MTRLFTGLSLPEETIDRLQSITGGVPGARWQSPEQMHLTLVFIGEADGAAVEDIHTALSGVQADRFDLEISGVGLFGTLKKPRNLWAGAVPVPGLMKLQEKVEKALARIGVRTPERKFTPHITLARFSNKVRKNHRAERLHRFLEMNGHFTAPATAIDHFCLFSSWLNHEGAIYTVEAEIPLD